MCEILILSIFSIKKTAFKQKEVSLGFKLHTKYSLYSNYTMPHFQSNLEITINKTVDFIKVEVEGVN